jgi:hypothetical protein
MPIPALNDRGFLPEGIHDCTIDEAQARFGVFQASDRRPQLWTKLCEFLREAKACGIVEAVLLDGSFVSGKPAPNDIDLILVVPAAHNFSADLTPAEYNVLSKRRVVRRYGFDVLVARAGSEEYRRYAAFFQQVRLEPGGGKGIVRLSL